MGGVFVATFGLALQFSLPAETIRAPGAATNQPRGNQKSPQELLGQQLFFDTQLSNPPGQSCASCHAPEAGFKFPDSKINQSFGVATGAISTRVTSRSAPTVAYAAYVPHGPPFAQGFSQGGALLGEALFVGGLFWDGHADDLEQQAQFPFLNPNEMNNLVGTVPSPEMVIAKVEKGAYADLFRQVYGDDAFDQPSDVIFLNIARALAAYERTPDVSPFTSRYDAWLNGSATLTPEEFDGLCLMTGSATGRPSGPAYYKNAQCTACHSIPDFPTEGPFLWTNATFANLGVPRNENNPFYLQTDPEANPAGYNPLGDKFVDLGLGGYLYPLNSLPPGNAGPGSNGFGDFLAINGTVRVPTLRNVDKRPYPTFVKAYMHNGAFKSLKEIVHFYNTRNLTTVPGEIIDLTLDDPYGGLRGTPLWPPPESLSLDSIENPTGDTPENGAQVGNLGLTDTEEDHIVAFLKTLTDGYFVNELPGIVQQPVSANVCEGSSVTFSAAATGTPVIFYQWYLGDVQLFDGQEISGASTPNLTIDPVGKPDVAANYKCVARNVAGNAATVFVSLNILVTGSGDGNGDGSADGNDIAGFVHCLTSPGSNQNISCAFDMNGDGFVTLADMNFFVFKLLNG